MAETSSGARVSEAHRAVHQAFLTECDGAPNCAERTAAVAAIASLAGQHLSAQAIGPAEDGDGFEWGIRAGITAPVPSIVANEASARWLCGDDEGGRDGWVAIRRPVGAWEDAPADKEEGP